MVHNIQHNASSSVELQPMKKLRC